MRSEKEIKNRLKHAKATHSGTTHPLKNSLTYYIEALEWVLGEHESMFFCVKRKVKNERLEREP